MVAWRREAARQRKSHGGGGSVVRRAGMKMKGAMVFVGPWAVLGSLADNRKEKCAGMFHVNSTCVASNLCQKSSEY